MGGGSVDAGVAVDLVMLLLRAPGLGVGGGRGGLWFGLSGQADPECYCSTLEMCRGF